MKWKILEGKKTKWKLFLIENLVWVLVISVYLAFAVVKPVMLSGDLILWVIYSAVPISFLVLGEAVVLITGNIDISLGEMTGFIAMVTAVVFASNGHWGDFSVFLPIALGVGCGAFNGFLVSALHLNSFLATLGTNMMFFGGTLLASSYVIFGVFPDSYTALGGEMMYAFLFLFITAFILWFILTKTVFGSNLYSIGGDSVSSKMMGIRVGKSIFSAYLLAGILCGLSAIAYTGYVNAVPPSLADNVILPVLAAAVIGGVTFTGGRGSVVNAIGGAILMGVITVGLVALAVNVFLRQVIFGGVVVMAIIINFLRDRFREKWLRPPS